MEQWSGFPVAFAVSKGLGEKQVSLLNGDERNQSNTDH